MEPFWFETWKSVSMICCMLCIVWQCMVELLAWLDGSDVHMYTIWTRIVGIRMQSSIHCFNEKQPSLYYIATRFLAHGDHYRLYNYVSYLRLRSCAFPWMSLSSEKTMLLSVWTNENFLHLNTNKCCYMLFSKKHHLCQPVTQLVIKGQTLERVTTFKYLGVLFSHNGSWSAHITNV